MNVTRRRGVVAPAIALMALFVALGGTAGAAEQAAVPLAKRALLADNAKKLGGFTAVQVATGEGSRRGASLGRVSAREHGVRPRHRQDRAVHRGRRRRAGHHCNV